MQFARKSELFARNVHLHILKIEHLYSTRKTQHFQFKLPKARFPNPIGHWQRSNDRGWPGGKEGGGGDLKLRIDRRTILTEVQ